MNRKLQTGLLYLCLSILLAACGAHQAGPLPVATVTPTPKQPEKLILRNWEGGISPEILEQFLGTTH